MPKPNPKGGDSSKQGGSSAWMVTFSDLSTLLLTFFVLLLSMSSMDDLKLKSLFHNFTASCGILLFKEYGEIYKPKEILVEGLMEKLEDALIVRKEEDAPKAKIPSDITANPLSLAGGALKFEDSGEGFKLTFGQALLFESGSAEIKNEGKPLLDQVAKFVLVSSYQIYIDGHTDNVPVHTADYPSNEALSLARAYNIIQYFIEEKNIPSDYMAMGGYGDLRPVAPNDSPEGRAQNRRVEMIFKNQKYF
jgi:chemotaxis protein MotB